MGIAGPLEALRRQAVVCRDCGLAETRRHVVFGEGNPEADLMLIGEGPGEWEDRTGRPFVGRAGKLLDEVLRENGIDRKEIYITNVVKCRPFVMQGGGAKNRPPRVGEVEACRKWLEGQWGIVRPSVILCVGGPAASLIIHKDFKMTQERGVWFRTQKVGEGRPQTGEGQEGESYAPFCMAVLHPAYVLRQEGEAFAEARRLLVEDIAEAKRKVEEIRARRRVSGQMPPF